MNLRTPLILFAVLLVLVGVFFILQFLGVKTPAERKEQDRWLLAALHPAGEKFATVGSGEFDRVVIERKEPDSESKDRLEFKRQPSGWRMVSPKDVRTGSRSVDMLVDQFINAEKDKKTELSNDLAQYGLDRPQTTVTLYRTERKGDQKVEHVYTINFGKQSPHKDNPVVYVTTSENPNKPLAVSKSRVDRTFAPVNEFRDKELLGSTLNLLGLRLAGANRKPLQLEKIDGKDWVIREPKLGDADTKATDDLATALANIRVEKNEDFVSDGPLGSDDLARYGLSEDKAAHVVTVRSKSPDDSSKVAETTLLIGVKDTAGETRAAFSRDAALVGEIGAPTPTAPAVLALLGAFHVRERQSQEAGAYFAKLKDDNTVVRIGGKHLAALTKSVDDLRSKALARIDATQVDAVNLTSGGETLRLRRPQLKVKTDDGNKAAPAPSEWELHTDRQATVKTHLDSVPSLVDALNKVTLNDAKAFLDDDPKQREWFGMDPIDLGLDKPQAEIQIWENGIQRDKDGKPEGSGEPKLKDELKNKPTVRIAIGRKDEKRNVVYVRRQQGDNPPAILAVPDPWFSAAPPSPPQSQPFAPPPSTRERISLTEKATGGYMAFRDHQLPSFKPNEVTKITYTRGGETYELERDQKTDEAGSLGTGWLVKKPVEGKASPMVDFLLFQLSRISADKLLTDRASERDRKEKFGLVDGPLLKVTVTAKERDKKDPSTFTYVIGKQSDTEGEAPKPYYARIEVKPAEGSPPDANEFVFLAPYTQVQALDAELRDTTVFPLESTAKAESLTLTWRDKAKKFAESKLELAYQPEKEGSSTKIWSVKSCTVEGKDAKANLGKLDSAKIEQLVGSGAPVRGVPCLNPLSTERFMKQGVKPDAKDRLDPASMENPPALVIEARYDNKSTRTLIIGEEFKPKKEAYPGLRQPAYYYAAASALPNGVFLLGEPEWKGLVAGPDYFKLQEKMALR